MLCERIPAGWIAQAPAKVNLYLRIVRRRDDGFHEIETVMARISLCDTLLFQPTDEPALGLTIRPAYPVGLPVPPVPADSSNLVIRAARLLQQATGTARGAQITLVKRIPAAAGLGGGSSDAATTLAALNQLWSIGLSAAELYELAAQLGSDVPFFLADSPWALCTGRGEVIESFSAPQPLHLVLARPEAGLATADVYRHCRPSVDATDSQPLIAALRTGRCDLAAHLLRNNLQVAAAQCSSVVDDMSRLFDQLPVWNHQLTGSGSAYFGVAPNHRVCQISQQRLRQLGAAWSCAVVTSL